ncbi:MAG: hypothetical protein R2713_08560 [Ilumatobacteraceae bacterium]
MHSTVKSTSSPVPGVDRSRARAVLRLRRSQGRRERCHQRRHRRRHLAAQQVVQEIEARGGEAIVNGENVADWEGAPAHDQRRDRATSATSTSSSTTPASCATGSS